MRKLRERNPGIVARARPLERLGDGGGVERRGEDGDGGDVAAKRVQSINVLSQPEIQTLLRLPRVARPHNRNDGAVDGERSGAAGIKRRAAESPLVVDQSEAAGEFSAAGSHVAPLQDELHVRRLPRVDCERKAILGRADFAPRISARRDSLNRRTTVAAGDKDPGAERSARGKVKGRRCFGVSAGFRAVCLEAGDARCSRVKRLADNGVIPRRRRRPRGRRAGPPTRPRPLTRLGWPTSCSGTTSVCPSRSARPTSASRRRRIRGMRRG
mmetsp:Transcript_18688/g.64328  ORF Transcript_18688/g.64328 Transcript_18688/m.64328 type:complete len:270 (+) Transcript_18688:1568-2377(+)